MTVESVHCAICGSWVALDQDHVEIEAEHVHIEDRNDRDEFVLHLGCWQRLSEGWMQPA